MLKVLCGFFFFIIISPIFGQTLEEKMQQQSAQNKFNNQSNIATNDDEWEKMFNNLSHPLAITGGILTLGGAGLYVAGSEGKNNHNYQPKNGMQYAGIGVFVAGAVLFTIFSTERDEKTPKRKKNKAYNANDWEVSE